MSWKRIALSLVLGFAVLVAAIVIGFSTKDEVERRYDTMAIQVEDRCKLIASAENCKKYSKCYRDGIAKAYPRDAMLEYAFNNSRAPQPIENAHMALQRNCLLEAGVKISG